ncbi:MAG: DUF5703 domain-containing protein, partial [Planctomycetota bacterium]
MQTQKTFWLILCIVVFCSCLGFGKEKTAQNFNDIESYNVVWDSPSKDSSGSMPIGNGDIGLNLWVEENGDLLFYISKTDLWSDNCRLLKLGRIRIKLSTNPFGKGNRFYQTLKLRQGEIEIVAGSPEKQITLRVWVDANRPVIYIEAKGKKTFDLQCNLEVWRNETRQLKGDEANSARALTRSEDYQIIAYPDVVLPAQNNRIVWYHRNEKSCYPVTLKNQHLDQLLAKYRDPLLHRTFGGCMKGDGLKAVDKQILKSAKSGKRFVVSFYPLTAQTKTIDTWLSLLKKQVAAIDAIDLKTAREKHRMWWSRFWKRSWIYVGDSKDAEVVTRGYNLQRWINACGGRGAYPIKFNGSIFTVDAKVGKEHFDGD